MYSKYFGFEEFPFSVTPDPRFFYSNAVYQDVLAGLEHGIEARNGFIVVTGEAGTGKTTLLHRLVSSSADSIDYALIINPRLSFIPLLRTILKNLGLPSSSTDRETLLEQLNSHLREQFTKGRTVALLFDEAQSLSDEVLEELRLLCNQEIDGATLTSIVLMGQPELEHRLDHSKLRQIKQRITSRRRLIPLQDDDVGLYLTSRLKNAGYTGDGLFAPAAVERVIDWSSGLPRLINTICDNALLRAYRKSEYTITAEIIDEVARQLRLVERSPRVQQKRIGAGAHQMLFAGCFPDPDHKQMNAVADQPRFVDSAPSVDQEQIEEITHQPRLTDSIPDAEEKQMDEVVNRLRSIDDSPSADQKTVPENDKPQNLDKSFSAESLDSGNTVDDAGEDRIQLTPPKQTENFSTPFSAVPVESSNAADEPAMEDRDQLAPSGFDHPQNLEEPFPTQSIEASDPVDDLARDDSEQLAPSEVDHPENVATHFPILSAEASNTVDTPAGEDGNQLAPSEIDHPQNIAKSSSEFEAGSTVDDSAREVSDPLPPTIDQAKTVVRRHYQLSKANRLRISIGALMILIVVAGGLAVFYPRQREAAVPGNSSVKNPSGEAHTTAAPAKPVDEVSNAIVMEEQPQRVLVSPPPSPVVPENVDQNRADAPKKQKIVEVRNTSPTTGPPSQEIYRVSGPSFLRKRPTADAEIIDTLQPGTRIAVTRSGEYYVVRSLGDKAVSGFVHKEDAFFERTK